MNWSRPTATCTAGLVQEKGLFICRRMHAANTFNDLEQEIAEKQDVKSFAGSSRQLIASEQFTWRYPVVYLRICSANE